MAKEHQREDIIAPCGMNCSLCVSYQANLYDINQYGYKKRYCPGCIARGKNCTFLKKTCDVISQGKARFCLRCAMFPCDRLLRLDRRYREKYNMSMIDNLLTINQKGTDQLLEEEDIKWTCPTCGELMCCHTKTCVKCEINALKTHNKPSK